MTIASARFRFQLSLFVGVVAGGYLGPRLFPLGVAEWHGLGLWGNTCCIGVALALAFIAYRAIVPNRGCGAVSA